jgi:hypothetical protein
MENNMIENTPTIINVDTVSQNDNSEADNESNDSNGSEDENESNYSFSECDDEYYLSVSVSTIDTPFEIKHDIIENNHLENNCELCKMCNKCSICSEYFTDDLDANIIKTKCNHIFHETCMLDWFSEDEEKSCPLCRNEFKIEQSININELKNHDIIKNSKSIELIYPSSNVHGCDLCDQQINNGRYHLKNKNYDLCVSCYNKMLDAYNNKIDYNTLRINSYSVIDKNFCPDKYDFYDIFRYDLDNEYDDLSIQNVKIDKNIISKNGKYYFKNLKKVRMGKSQVFEIICFLFVSK